MSIRNHLLCIEDPVLILVVLWLRISPVIDSVTTVSVIEFVSIYFQDTGVSADHRQILQTAFVATEAHVVVFLMFCAKLVFCAIGETASQPKLVIRHNRQEISDVGLMVENIRHALDQFLRPGHLSTSHVPD
jgi:hypothetical protein